MELLGNFAIFYYWKNHYLNIDNDNRISMTDIRLLRRMIRDNRTRGYSPDKTFESFSLDINLFDSDEIIVDTEYASVSNFAPGQKAKLEFMTDVDFVKYEVSWDYYTK